MRWRALAAAGISALAVAGCGGDDNEPQEQRAQDKVCDARASISKELDTLRDTAVAQGAASAVQSSVQSIRNELKTIKDAQPELNDERKQEIQQANDAFTAAVRTATVEFARSLAAGGTEARAEVRAAADRLASTYRQAFAPVSCP